MAENTEQPREDLDARLIDALDRGRKGGRSVAGKDLSDSQSSARKGRKSSTSTKKFEEEAK